MTSVNVIAFENGVGNSRDLRLMREVLQTLGCEVSVTAPSRHARRRRRSAIVRTLAQSRRWLIRHGMRKPPPFDLNVMMEHIWPEELHSARRNIVMPNPEWFDRGDQRLLTSVDCVWSKTVHSLQAFSQLDCATEFVGFDSEDRYDASVPRVCEFFHLAGKSRMKGTSRLVLVWSHHPEWPPLHVVHSRKAAFEVVEAANIHYESGYLSDSNLRGLQNRHKFHLCMSETEGWGHYIAEALSVGAIVIVPDAEPMNELVTAEHGLLVNAAALGKQHLAVTYGFDQTSLERAVEIVLAMNAADRQLIGERARASFCDNKRGFAARIGGALKRNGNR